MSTSFEILAQRIRAIESRFSHFVTVAPGDVIIRESDVDDRVFFLLSGSIKVTNYSIKGREVWHSKLGAGIFIGELAALTGAPRSVNITALEASRLVVLSKTQFFELLRSDPEIGIWLLQDLADRLLERTEKMSSLVAQTTPQRIRAALLRLANPAPSSGSELVVSPVPNFTELAKQLNTDRENVSREISALGRIGVIRRDDTSIHILDREFLEDSAIV